MRFLLPTLLLLLPAAASATDVQGMLLSDVTWDRRGSPYILKGDVTVAWGTTLTIEPGVEVLAASEDATRSGVDPERVELVVEGTLVARGSEALPVTFSAHEPEGLWVGLRVGAGRGTVLERVSVRKAWRGVWLDVDAVVRNSSVSGTVSDCIYVSGGTARLEGNHLSGCGRNGLFVDPLADADVADTVVTGCAGNGIVLHGGGSLHHNTVRDNGLSGVVLFGSGSTPVVRDSVIASNGGYGVYQPATAQGRVAHNNVWSNQAGDYGARARADEDSLSEDPRLASSSGLGARPLQEPAEAPVALAARDSGPLPQQLEVPPASSPPPSPSVEAPAGEVVASTPPSTREFARMTELPLLLDSEQGPRGASSPAAPSSPGGAPAVARTSRSASPPAARVEVEVRLEQPGDAWPPPLDEGLTAREVDAPDGPGRTDTLDRHAAAGMQEAGQTHETCVLDEPIRAALAHLPLASLHRPGAGSCRCRSSWRERLPTSRDTCRGVTFRVTQDNPKGGARGDTKEGCTEECSTEEGGVSSSSPDRFHSYAEGHPQGHPAPYLEAYPRARPRHFGPVARHPPGVHGLGERPPPPVHGGGCRVQRSQV